jgi:hypothetical protein
MDSQIVNNKIMPLVLTNQKIGQRHYFDCYESAFGGLIASYINNHSFVRNLYSIIDCFSLCVNENKSINVISRAIEVNGLTREILGVNLISLSNFVDLIKINEKNKPFVISFDEFYLQENSHYRKTHFNHASLGLEIIDRLNVKIMDPGLEITKPIGYSADERIISFDEDIYNDNEGVRYFILEANNNFSVDTQSVEWQKNVIKNLEKLNIDLWKNHIKPEQDFRGYYFGTKALEVFAEFLSDYSKVEKAASEFYKWIFPIYWKQFFLRKNDDELSQSLGQLLATIVKEMEIFETNLLRLKATYKHGLHDDSIKRWNKIISLFRGYFEKEEKRILESENKS